MGNICPGRVLIWHMQAQINMEIGSVNKELVNCFHFEVYATWRIYSMLLKFIVILYLIHWCTLVSSWELNADHEMWQRLKEGCMIRLNWNFIIIVVVALTQGKEGTWVDLYCEHTNSACVVKRSATVQDTCRYSYIRPDLARTRTVVIVWAVCVHGYWYGNTVRTRSARMERRV